LISHPLLFITFSANPKYWLLEYCDPTQVLYLAIDRTQWAATIFLMIALIWDKRAIPLYFIMLPKKGRSNLASQQAALEKVSPLIKEYKTVVLGDREFCSVKLAKCLGEQNLYFCLRLKKTEYVQHESLIWTELKNLGLAPGMSSFMKGVKLTKAQGFAGANLAAKWKRKYRGVSVKEGGFIVTNLKNLDAAINTYKQRFDIEEMFRDGKTGGYNIEESKVSPSRLQAFMVLITLAYSITTLSGYKFKKMGVQKYVAPPKESNRAYRRYRTFQVGVRGENWVNFINSCHQEIQEYVSLHQNHRSNYQSGQRAASLIIKEL